jgi:hypothetical protein
MTGESSIGLDIHEPSNGVESPLGSLERIGVPDAQDRCSFECSQAAVTLCNS